MKGLLACVLGLSLVAVSSGSGYSTRTYQNHAYVHNQAFILAVPVAADYYYSVGEGANDAERAKKIAQEVVRQIEEKFSSQEHEGGSSQSALVSGMFRLSGGGTIPLADDGPTLEVLLTHCAGCHKPGASRPGGIQLFTADRKMFSESDSNREQERRQAVYESIRDGSMPKGRAPLSVAEKSLVREWSKKR